MRSLAVALVLLILVHVLALAAGVAWLYGSGRLNRERVERVVDVFRPTLEQERRAREEAEVLEAEAEAQAARVARLEAVADGPITLGEVLQRRQRGDEVGAARLDRLQRERAALEANHQLALAELKRQREALDAEREAFVKQLERHNEPARDEAFQQAVQMYEQLDAGQAKAMLQELLDAGEQRQVVDYLAAMQLRKAAAILGEFETQPELAQASRLVEALRQRGVFDREAAAAGDTEGGGL